MRRTFLKALVLGVTLSSMSVFARSPDGLLTSRAKLALWTKAGVRSTAVHVDADEGVITLYGKVPTLEQKSLADDTVRGIDGVRGVRNLLQIVADVDEKRVTRSDAELLEQSNKVLSADFALEGSKISVKAVDKGVALLTGDARTLSEQLRAVALVDRVPGIRRVASEVKEPDVYDGDESVAVMNEPTWKHFAESKSTDARKTASDIRISAMVKLHFLTAAQVPSAEISVDTEDGVVTLFGMVPTAHVKRAAAMEAGNVSGVLKVHNELEVVSSIDKPSVVAKDADITRDIAIAFKDRTDFKSIDTSVKHGVVRLTGTVHSGWDELSAVRVTRQVAGVRGIDDQLKVDHEAASKTTQRE
jgi:hyperosmotically inducible protein